ncbi:hypothetical protein EJB05_10906 [Eragrostis curvula]|uniref:Uncharacterized protein n=1 Tax=Eragrostis curvula TaxID=38414 RepID=A0A5J9VN45_9POAL|nr:hypothetical protein EJB05_52726 [Eragrostis curvula]TVU25210.1 hypothetical protein EJB05_27698 [Eragrostis curvula]TVU37583.1 hypothetical protein EJB05_10906 [Eragrostis curvula]
MKFVRVRRGRRMVCSFPSMVAGFGCRSSLQSGGLSDMKNSSTSRSEGAQAQSNGGHRLHGLHQEGAMCHFLEAFFYLKKQEGKSANKRSIISSILEADHCISIQIY